MELVTVAAVVCSAKALQHVLEEHINPWGISCQSVGIKDIVIPKSLSGVMSKQAQAERELPARIIPGTAETGISEKFTCAAEKYSDNPIAFQLRGMNMLFGIKVSSFHYNSRTSEEKVPSLSSLAS